MKTVVYLSFFSAFLFGCYKKSTNHELIGNSILETEYSERHDSAWYYFHSSVFYPGKEDDPNDNPRCFVRFNVYPEFLTEGAEKAKVTAFINEDGQSTSFKTSSTGNFYFYRLIHYPVLNETYPIDVGVSYVPSNSINVYRYNFKFEG